MTLFPRFPRFRSLQYPNYFLHTVYSSLFPLSHWRIRKETKELSKYIASHNINLKNEKKKLLCRLIVGVLVWRDDRSTQVTTYSRFY